MPSLIKPRHIRPGDRIAAITPSWGGPGTFPHRYAVGKAQLEAAFGVSVVEMEHTLAPADWIINNPKARADDMMAAFADPSIAGIVASIGGDDSIRLLPYLDLDVIRANPKVFLGYSDTTSLHMACYAAGLTSFYGPSIMSGFGENGGMHAYTADGLRRALFGPSPIGTVPFNTEGWTDEHLDWSDPAHQTRKRRMNPAERPRILQGTGTARGHLLGGCFEVMEMVRGSRWWPTPEQWSGAILFLETSEDVPTPSSIRYALRNYAVTGILEHLSGVLISRATPGTVPNYQHAIELAVIGVLAEAGRADMPVLAGLDFGHTQPMLTLPYGVTAEIDCDVATLTILDAGVS